MKRLVTCFVLAFAVTGHAAWADDQTSAPTKDDLEAAKKAFVEGRALYNAGNVAEAIAKFEESYRLSRNPVLLYNIAHAYDQADQNDKALTYYKRFLADAPSNAAQRDDVTKRVAELEHEKPELPSTSAEPTSKYSAADFRHQLVESVPPFKAYDVTAVVPEDSGLVVTLFFRGSGDETFTSKPMKWRNKELVARIPPSKIAGNSIQYYLEVRDPAAKLVTRSGKSTVPNLVAIDAAAKPHFYADLVGEGETSVEPKPDPVVQPSELKDEQRAARLRKATWISTGVTIAFGTSAIVTYFLAKHQYNRLLADSTSCGVPPCRVFDATFDQQVEASGERYNTIYHVTLGASVAAAAVAGYFWYRELTTHKRSEVTAAHPAHAPAMTWIVAPAIGTGFAGACAEGRF